MDKLREILEELIRAQLGDMSDEMPIEQLSLEQAEREIKELKSELDQTVEALETERDWIKAKWKDSVEENAKLEQRKKELSNSAQFRRVELLQEELRKLEQKIKELEKRKDLSGYDELADTIIDKNKEEK